MIPKDPPASEMKNGLGQKMPQDVAAYGAPIDCGRRFPCAFGHAHQHNIHDADSGRTGR